VPEVKGENGRWLKFDAKNVRRREWAKQRREPRSMWIDRVIVGDPDDCWRWDGPHHSSGYPFAAKDGVVAKAHRHVASLFAPVTGPVHHTCENRWCVNPRHLLVTRDNAEHKRHHRQERCIHGHLKSEQPNGRWICKLCAARYAREHRRRAREARSA